MSNIRFAVVAAGLLAAVSCSQQPVPVQPGPVEGPGVEITQGLPFAVPEGALFVARSRRAANVYRIQTACRPLHVMNPSSVVFFWTLEAAKRGGFRLSDEEGCR